MSASAGRGRNRRGGGPVRGLPALPGPVPPGQLVAAAGGAVVTAARVGRLLSRSSWRIARQLPGMGTLERESQRLRQAAADEVLRLLDVPQVIRSGVGAGLGAGLGATDTQRLLLLLQDSGDDPAPLRTAMAELLERAAEPGQPDDREYLFGSIVSQLVPDEARIVATLAGRRGFAAVDVVVKQLGRAETRPLLQHVSTVAVIAGTSRPEDGVTYLDRLERLGLLEFDEPDEELSSQYDELMQDAAVQRARSEGDGSRLGSARVVRRTVRLSPLGEQFWAACAPVVPVAVAPAPNGHRLSG